MSTKRIETTSLGSEDLMNPNGLNSLLLSLANNRDESMKSVARSVESLASDFNRKLDEADRDTRKQFESFNNSVANQFQNITTKFEAAMAARDAKFEAFSTKVLESGKAQWPLILLAVSVGIAILGALGTLAYQPIAQQQSDLKLIQAQIQSDMKATFDKLADNQNLMREFMTTNFVTIRDLESRTERGKEDRDRTNRALETLQNTVFSKDVHKEKWDNFERQIASNSEKIDAQVANLQREIDAIQKSLGDTYTARDALFEQRNRISELERLIREIFGRRAGTPMSP